MTGALMSDREWSAFEAVTRDEARPTRVLVFGEA